jgi:hypothetical protein
VSGATRAGVEELLLVPRDAPAVVLGPVHGQGDDVPLPIPAVVRETPQGDVVELPASGDPFFLGFAAGPHHPPAQETVSQRLLDQTASSYTDGRPSPETYAFVMFSGRMTPARLARLEQEGCRLLGFHPHYTQKVALSAAAIDPVAALPFVRWVGCQEPWQKVHPDLTSALGTASPNVPLEVWVNVFDSDVGLESVHATSSLPLMGGPQAAQPQVGTFELSDLWVTNGWQQLALESAGLEIEFYSERVRAFRARMLPGALPLVTALDFVQFVERLPESRTLHDESMALINADDLRNFYDGGVHQRAGLGIADTGLLKTHQDLDHVNSFGFDLTSTGTWLDLCGHGTHVAGTIFGNGELEAGHKGIAPGIGWDLSNSIYVAKVLAGCSGSVNHAFMLNIMTTQWGALRPHVINNSYGIDGVPTAPWIGTETVPRLFDGVAYGDAQLSVIAAGNGGPIAQTITQEASSKNSLTVGAAIDTDDLFGTLPGDLWNGTSRGPCGDGRWKPSVIAPGSWITSADKFNTGAYYNNGGTSMASAHVTGVIADLIDADGTLAYLPERITAQLMATARAKDGFVYSSPSYPTLDKYGAGRIDATRANWSGGGSTWTSWAFALPSGWYYPAPFTVPPGATRLVAVMNYSDVVASAGASVALVNDVDLYLDQPPLDPGFNTGEWTAQQSTVDNTEIRVIEDPIPGDWQFKVYPESTTSTTYVGVTIYIETTDSTPSMAPTLSSSHTYAAPGETVTFDYALSTPGSTLSAVHLTASPSAGGLLLGARTTLMDGVVTDLLNNEEDGWELTLGNVDPYFTRTAAWDLAWPTEGTQLLCVRTYCDNASNNAVIACGSVIVDGTAPSSVAGLSSSTHSIGVKSCDTSVTMNWGAATDPVSGVAGYEVLWSHKQQDTPTLFVPGQSWTQQLPDTSFNPWYFHVRALDNAGNAGPVTSAGPYLTESFPVFTYCTAKLNSQNCTPGMWTSGTPSLQGGAFETNASGVVNNKSGLLFWGTAKNASPFQGGTKCVLSPVRRTPVQNSGGGPPPDDCSGTYQYTWTASYMTSKGLKAGDTVYCQYWSRDPQAPFTTGLTDGVEFSICP